MEDTRKCRYNALRRSKYILTVKAKKHKVKVHQEDAISFLAKQNGNFIRWELPPYKTNGNFIRWEPYHIKQMGTISDGNPTGKKECVKMPFNHLLLMIKGLIFYRMIAKIISAIYSKTMTPPSIRLIRFPVIQKT